jgi:hypothetical protein
MAVAGEQTHTAAVPPHHQAETVVLDLVEPVGAGGQRLNG